MLNLNSDTDAKSSCPENNEPSAVEAFEVIWEQLVQLPIGTVEQWNSAPNWNRPEPLLQSQTHRAAQYFRAIIVPIKPTGVTDCLQANENS